MVIASTWIVAIHEAIIEWRHHLFIRDIQQGRIGAVWWATIDSIVRPVDSRIIGVGLWVGAKIVQIGIVWIVIVAKAIGVLAVIVELRILVMDLNQLVWWVACDEGRRRCEWGWRDCRLTLLLLLLLDNWVEAELRIGWVLLVIYARVDATIIMGNYEFNTKRLFFMKFFYSPIWVVVVRIVKKRVQAVRIVKLMMLLLLLLLLLLVQWKRGNLRHEVVLEEVILVACA
jgi:hypothetical protein